MSGVQKAIVNKFDVRLQDWRETEGVRILPLDGLRGPYRTICPSSPGFEYEKGSRNCIPPETSTGGYPLHQ